MRSITMTKKLPSWKLSDLFKSPQDPQIKKTFTLAQKQALAFEKKYKGKLATVIKKSPKQITAVIEQYDEILTNAAKPLIFANLLYAESSTAKGRGAFVQQMRTEYLAINSKLLFFELELGQLPKAVVTALRKSKKLGQYEHYFEEIQKNKAHQLSESEEKLLADRDMTGRSALIRLFTEEFAERRYDAKISGKSGSYSDTQLLNLLYSPKRDVRKGAALAFSTGLKKDSRRLAFIFNMLAQDKQVVDRYRQYKDSEESRHLSNQIDPKVVSVMTEVIVDNYNLVQEVYKIKRKKMKLTELYDYDRYAPLGVSDRTFTFQESKTIILDAFQRFSPEMARITKQFFDKNWIDAADRDGKRGGAFCSFVTPDRHPYVFMNYKGTVRDLFTLAHELGHAVHAVLMKEQPYLYFNVPLTVAETASVFAEMLVFEYLVGNTRKSDRFALYLRKLENIFATVFRQTSMYRFEQDFHSARLKEGELPVERINKLWRGRQTEMFGKSVTLTEGYDYWWSYIPHFLHTPFYVYAYAFGELLTMSLYAIYREQGKNFVDPYFSVLSAGGSQSSEKLFKPLGLKLQTKEFWQGGMNLIAEMVGELR